MAAYSPEELSDTSSSALATDTRRFEGMRAAMVTFSPYPFDPRPRRTVDALVREGMIVDLICLGDKTALSRESHDGVEILRVRVNKEQRGGRVKYAYRYASFILFSSLIFGLRSVTRGYDLVYVHNMPEVLVLSALIPKALGAKVILDMHDPMPELMMAIFNVSERDRVVRLVRHLEKWSLGRADLVFTVNIACKRLFSSRSCSVGKIDIVMNSPDEQIFPLRRPQLQIHGQTVDKDKPFVILYHGSLVERNGLDLAIDALAGMREKGFALELRVCGHSTPYLEHVMHAARIKNVDLRYLGPKRLEDLVSEIDCCDVGVIPNHHNAFAQINTPTRIFEYLARGKPVIAPRTPGIRDYFTQESLFFFEAGNSNELAMQIRYIRSHPAEALEMARRGQQIYLAHRWSQERKGLVKRVGELLNVTSKFDVRSEPCS
jgi:glycosyltransferase involved in cell wall biosynthesis